jgi:DNA polymerase III subunit epsilon
MSEAVPIRYKRWDDIPIGVMNKSALKEKGLKPGPACGQIYLQKRRVWIDLYDEREAIPRKPATEKQLAALQKARVALEFAKTCPRCRSILSIPLNGKLCEYCVKQLWLEDQSQLAHSRFCEWVDRKDDFAVLDLETTGLDDEAEILELAIVDLEGELLFHSLVRPERAIPAESTLVHGITDDMVSGAPSWPEVWAEVRALFVKRTALIFNKRFDSRKIYAACRRYGLPAGWIDSECVMDAYARFMKSYSEYHKEFTWISLQQAVMAHGILERLPHRAIGDSTLTVRLIRAISSTKEGINSGVCS